MIHENGSHLVGAIEGRKKRQTELADDAIVHADAWLSTVEIIDARNVIEIGDRARRGR